MNPLLFVNWRQVAAVFTALSWLAVVVLVCFCAARLTPPAHGKQHRQAPRSMAVR